jgi:hypothetical protein
MVDTTSTPIPEANRCRGIPLKRGEKKGRETGALVKQQKKLRIPRLAVCRPGMVNLLWRAVCSGFLTKWSLLRLFRAGVAPKWQRPLGIVQSEFMTIAALSSGFSRGRVHGRFIVGTFHSLRVLAAGVVLVLAFIAIALRAPAEPDPLAPSAGDLVAVLAAADPVWERLPGDWWEAPYLGNGMLGATVRALDEHHVAWQVGRSDVEDHRVMNYGMGRLPIGQFVLETKGALTGCDLRLDLLRGELVGAIHTSAGQVEVRSLVHGSAMAMVVRWKGTGAEVGASWAWKASEAIHPRLAIKPDPEYAKTWTPNPAGYATEVAGLPVWVQPLSEGGYATAWHAFSPTELPLL